MAALTSAERQRRWRERQPKHPRAKRPVTVVYTPTSKQIERPPSAELVAAFDRDWPKLSRYVRAHLYGTAAKQDAEDIASEVRARFLTSGGTIRDEKNVRRWARTVADRLITDRGREAAKEAVRIAATAQELLKELPAKPTNRDDENAEKDSDKGSTDEDYALNRYSGDTSPSAPVEPITFTTGHRLVPEGAVESWQRTDGYRLARIFR